MGVNEPVGGLRLLAHDERLARHRAEVDDQVGRAFMDETVRSSARSWYALVRHQSRGDDAGARCTAQVDSLVRDSAERLEVRRMQPAASLSRAPSRTACDERMA